jgi:hypothetical protein
LAPEQPAKAVMAEVLLVVMQIQQYEPVAAVVVKTLRVKMQAVG